MGKASEMKQVLINSLACNVFSSLSCYVVTSGFLTHRASGVDYS